MVALGLPMLARADGTKAKTCLGKWGMMSGGAGFGGVASVWSWLMMLGYFVWLLVGVMLILFLWKKVNSKK
tara:strand:+ start:254 stop:466 length:213 start_codon:yes stop_codon:yes gene_type:complete